ncbi:DUF5641 domain-containing protein [Trichonephila clavipes]|uniref:DUF5641 domain-containing protein n=1 Tax=Trichonephila clavipes TaxID=2585209 RepID=A0A8X7B823_TRICX|nr:DUF5641 domain-containing protein [Trichonephila clavipes]
MKLAPQKEKIVSTLGREKVLESSSEELTFEPHIHTIALASTKRCVSWGSERDSTIALNWIKTPPHLHKTLVANKVTKMQELMVNFSWDHISSENNTADLVSRGLNVSDLKNSSLWWKDPDPSIFTNDELLENIIDSEAKKELKIPSFKNLVLSSEFDLKFITLFVEIEAVFNSRPLSPLSSDFDDFETLSPGHFLIGRPVTAIIEPHLIIVKENGLTRWKKVNRLSPQIWKVRD